MNAEYEGSLDAYLDKRDFRRTPEPKGDGEPASHDEGPQFVIHEHDASTHHFDLRLEVDGVLVSWAVPKGPSTDPREKRLALRTEDHPLAYAGFEGVIPEDEYGGGTVLVWDAGIYRNLKGVEDGDEDGGGEDADDGEARPMSACVEDGHITVWLEGEKVRGGYALIRTDRGGDDGDDDDERWLLVKMDDDEADARRNPVSTEPQSVLSGRTIEEVAEEEAPEDGDDEGAGDDDDG